MSCDGHKKVKAILKDLEYLVVIVIDAGGWEVVGLEARKAGVSHSSWLRRFLE